MDEGSSEASFFRRSPALDELLLALLVVLYAAFLPWETWGDGMVRYGTLVELAEHAELSSARYPLTMSLLGWPLYLLGKLVDQPGPVVWATNLVLFSAFAWGARSVLDRLLGPELRARTLLLLAAGSALVYSLRHFYGEVLGVCALTLALASAAEGRRAGALLAAAVTVWNTPPAAVAVAVAVVLRGLDARRKDEAAARGSMGLALGLGLGAAIAGAENLLRRGALTDFGYAQDAGFPGLLPYAGQPGFSYPLVLGVLALLFSFGKGILFWSPGLWLAGEAGRIESPTTRTFVHLTLGATGGLLLVYGGWWAWYGGWFLGPRFLLFSAVPASVLLARATLAPPDGPGRAALVCGLVLASCWIGVVGAAFGLFDAALCAENRYELEHLCWYVPEYAGWARPFTSTQPWGPGRVAAVAGFGALALVIARIPLRALIVAAKSSLRFRN